MAEPFEIVSPGKSKKGNRGILIAVLVVVFLILSVIAGVLLVRQRQNIAEKAATTASQCPAAEACPYPQDRTLLRNCTPAEADNSPAESSCSAAGRIESCGGQQFCCPAPGAAWTTNMQVCNSLAVAAASPTANPTVTPTATPEINACNGTCTNNSDCQSGLFCYNGACRNALCSSDTTCNCTGATATPVPTLATTTAPTVQTTPRPIPVTGTDWPTYLGAGVGVVVIIASILIAL